MVYSVASSLNNYIIYLPPSSVAGCTSLQTLGGCTLLTYETDSVHQGCSFGLQVVSMWGTLDKCGIKLAIIT